MSEINILIIKDQLELFESQCQMLKELIYSLPAEEINVKEIVQYLVEINRDLMRATYKLRKDNIKHE